MSQPSRAPKFDLSDILAQPHPQIDLRLDAFEASTRKFLKALSNYHERAIVEITKRRERHAAEKKKLNEKASAAESETTQCKVREIELVAELEREQEEKRDAEQGAASFKRQLFALREKCASVDVEIEQYRALTSNLQREKNKESATLHAHAAYASPELRTCENRLRSVIEGIKEDQILVRFSHIDRLDTDKEFSFVLDVGSRIYRVLTITPVLPTMPIFLEELNESRDFYGFIKAVRAGFEELASQGH
ncbi:hypothetical protein FIBSPDRAFT_803198 [Athelia psychrophila]|uniref:Kinetochore protein SPC25 n=1 Tax=Athelia psychrophila TaxID=1759441 RepID=A0A165X6Q4_9AGAM|nr:hypothetical protein FIBSPDRAFT_803198 [Fibularhizoctonia sp. CBS 109695]